MQHATPHLADKLELLVGVRHSIGLNRHAKRDGCGRLVQLAQPPTDSIAPFWDRGQVPGRSATTRRRAGSDQLASRSGWPTSSIGTASIAAMDAGRK